ncbi:MAG: oligosaccharide flippase family protein [Patescibacteria group bacterium]
MFNEFELKPKQLLLKIGDFLKTDIRYIMKQGSWLAGGEIINNILSVGLIVAFANLISPSNYGIYKYILSIYAIFALSGLSGSGPAITKSVAEGNEGIYSPALKLQRKWALIGSLGTLVTALYYLSHGNKILGYSFIVATIVLPFFESQNTYQHILSGKKRFDLQIKYYSGTRIVSTVSIILALFLTQNVIIIVAAYFIPYILANFYFGYLALKQIKLNNNFDSSIISYMKHLSLIGVFSATVNYLDSIIIFQLLGPVQLAIYTIALAPATRLQSFFGIIPELSLPKYAEHPVDEIKKAIFPKILKAIPICILIVISYILIVPLFFKLFLPQYPESVRYAQLLALPFIWYPFALLARVLLVKASIKQLYHYNILESVAQCIIMFLAIYFFGLPGAVIGIIATSIIGNIILYYYFHKL